MKKLSIRLSIIAMATALTFTSCSKEDNNIIGDESRNAITKSISQDSYFKDYDFEFVGTEHNKALESVYNKLSGADIAKLTPEELYNIAFAQSHDYITSSEKFTGYDENILAATIPSTNYASNDDFISDMETKVVSGFTSQFIKDKYDEINVILDKYASNEDVTLASTIEGIRRIETEIATTDEYMEEVEYAAIRSLISTNIYSLTYWEKNLDSWSALNPNASLARGGRDWQWFKGTVKKMGKADALGAAVGATVGFVASLWSGPGVLLGTAQGAVSGGCNGSAMAGIRALLED